MLKRILGICLVMAMAVSLMTAAPVYAADNSEVQLMNDLGIVTVSAKKGLVSKGYTRGDFAKTLWKMYGGRGGKIDVATGEAELYAFDIANHENYDSIAAVIMNDYMKTDENGRFNPGQSVTLNDVVYALINMLGYRPVAVSKGGTEDDYLAIATSIGILKGVKIANPDKLIANEVAEIVANSMSVRMLFGDVIIEGVCLWDFWDVTKYSGIILANSNLGLAVGKTGAQQVNISGTVYHTELLIPDSAVGSEVTYYTLDDENGYEEVVSIYIKNADDTLSLEAGDITSVREVGASIELTYGDDDEDITIQKSGFVIVNGKTQTPSKKLFDAFKSGTVTFVDSDRDGKFDIAHMTLLVPAVIEGLHAEFETFTTRFDGQKVNLGQVDTYEIYVNNKTATMKDLKEGMVVGIACDSFNIASNGTITYDYQKAELIKVYASLRSVSGIVNEINNKGIIVDGMDYNFGYSYENLVKKGYISPVEVGTYVIVYLDSFGEIAYYEIDSVNNQMKYGYIIAAEERNSTLDHSTEIKLMDSLGDFHILATGDSFILDGQRVDGGATTYNVSGTMVDLTKRQLIRYREIDGVLKAIDTKAVRAGAESPDNTLSEDLTFDPDVEGQPKRKIRSGTIDRLYAFSGNCIVFIDEAPVNMVNPSEYYFSAVQSSSISGSHYMAGYDANDINELSCIVRYDGYGNTVGSSMTYAEAYCYVVGDITETIDSEWNSGWRIELAGNNQKVSYFVSEETLKLYAAASLGANDTIAAGWGQEEITIERKDPSDFMDVIKSGDIIRFKLNAAGDIVYIEKLFDFESHKNRIVEVPNKNGQIYGFAKLQKISNNYMVYNYDDPSSDTSYISLKRPNHTTVPLYHVERGYIEMVELQNLPTAITGSEVKVFLRYYDFGIVYDQLFYVYD